MIPATGNPDGTGRRRFAGNIIPANRIDPLARRLLNDLLPLPNAGAAARIDQQPLRRRAIPVRPPHRRQQGEFQHDGKMDSVCAPQLAQVRCQQSDGLWRTRRRTEVSRTPPIPASATAEHGAARIATTYVVSPTFLMDAYYGYTLMDSNVEQPGLGPNTARDVYGIPGTNGTRRFESGNAGFGISGFRGVRQLRIPCCLTSVMTPSRNMSRTSTGRRAVTTFGSGFDIYRLALNHTQPEFPSAGNSNAAGRFNFNQGPTQLSTRERQRAGRHIAGKPVQRDGNVPPRSSHRWWPSAAGSR